MKHYCSTCGKELDCSKKGECWSDNQFAFTHSHLGGIECRDCYAKSHNFCSKCKDRPLNEKWSYCPWCGTKVA